MCDYSLEAVESREAIIGDKLVVSAFAGTITRGFAAMGAPECAVCLKPGTELAFNDGIMIEGFPATHRDAMAMNDKTATFRKAEINGSYHHDALELPGGRIVLLTHLRLGQKAHVLQLPMEEMPQKVHAKPVELVT